MGVDNTQGLILKYNTVMERLIKLEKIYKKADPTFKMIDMWTCNTHNWQIEFKVTWQCHDPTLKRKLLALFCKAVN